MRTHLSQCLAKVLILTSKMEEEVRGLEGLPVFEEGSKCNRS